MKRLIFFAVTLVILLAIHGYFTYHAIYKKVWWADIVLHLAGGIIISSTVLSYGRSLSLIYFIAVILCIGVGWEILEVLIDTPYFGVGGMRVRDPLWALDTMKDLIVNLLGASMAWKIWKFSNPLR